MKIAGVTTWTARPSNSSMSLISHLAAGWLGAALATALCTSFLWMPDSWVRTLAKRFTKRPKVASK